MKMGLHKGQTNSGSFKKGYTSWNKNLTKKTDKRMKNQSENLKGQHHSPKTEFKKGHKQSNFGRSHFKKGIYQGYGFKKGHKEHIEEREKRLRNVFKGNRLKPNKKELMIIKIMKENNFSFKYVGNGRFWLRGKKYIFNPDFLDNNKKLIIEIFGDYWHNKKEVKKRDKERIKTYSKYGYKTLIIWENELKNKFNVIKKITSFLQI